MFTKVIKNAKLEACVGRPVGLIYWEGRGGGGQELNVICAGLPNERRKCFQENEYV
jgi:hypothetical protein